MEIEDENEQIVRTLKSVKTADDKTEIVDIKERHGPLYMSIPKLPVGAAVICCFLNIVLPGFGTLISAFTVLCGAPTALNKKTAAFLFNLLSAFLQMITFIIIVGWVWSILWGMNMVTLAMNWGEEKGLHTTVADRVVLTFLEFSALDIDHMINNHTRS